MLSTGKRIFVALAALVAASTAAGGSDLRPAAAMITGSVTSQPIGHYEFCQRHVSECAVRSKVAAAPKLTEHGWQVLRDVNMSVNAEIIAMTDMEVYGKEEFWTYPVDAGDCEEFVLEKRKRLLEKGFSVADLLITVVRKPDGEGHAVLTVRTSQGDYILDNLSPDVKPWTETSYTYLKRQASFHTGRWVTIENGNVQVVGALR
ncbi:transglutaminase-like cysteine peptidase [Rhizobiaceae bacterium BDR2-2]|uniref:Transglutaminase-like cysteine peptidase n=1 Tax=Ectorhizobium quercum TaxID=2965071 RepID=A0AAE3N157_9HYPH|nr:transglutaminase-like cysteine peptidase [Ectorhizobium quercum]MCX8997996.1 transglutaminase-like cysteine peptidase [Ectorhizobium quercum]